MQRRFGACILAALIFCENRGKRSWASLTVSALWDLSVSRRRPGMRFASGAGALWRGPEAARVADVITEAPHTIAYHTRARIADNGWCLPRDVWQSARSWKTSMRGWSCAILPCKLFL